MKSRLKPDGTALTAAMDVREQRYHLRKERALRAKELREMKRQTATGFLAAMLIGLIIGGILYAVITAPGNYILRMSEEQLRMVHETNRKIDRMNYEAKHGLPITFDP